MGKRIVDEEMRFTVIINGNDAQKELFDLEKSTRNLTKENKDLRVERAKLSTQGKRHSEEYKNLTARIQRNSETLGENKRRMVALQSQIGITGLTIAQLGKKAAVLRIQLRNMVPGSAQYKKFEKDLQAVNTRMAQLRNGARATQGSLSKLANGFNKYQAIGIGFIATLTGMVLSIQKLLDYNGKLSDAQSDVRKTTQLNKIEVDELTKSFGLLKTRTARIELLKLAEEGGRLGIKGVKNIQAFLKVANELKVALGDDLSDEQIREVGKLVNLYKVAEKQGKSFAGGMTALGSAINEVSAIGANTAGYLVDFMKRQAGIAKQVGLSAQQNIGYAATFDELAQSVEVSATVMNKVWVDMFDDTASYAKIAGESLDDFTTLLNTDANAAMIKFLDGLNGNNEGFGIMVQKLKDLELGGARGEAVMSALASNTDLLKQRQEGANGAITEAISLTNEYSLKNNNLAGTIDKIKKRFLGFFSSQSLQKGLGSFAQVFARLIGATENLNDAFKEQSKVSFETIKSNRLLTDSGETLLEEYEKLTEDGVEPTEEAKIRLQDITVSLKNQFGESVVEIDKETGALTLNSEAVREQIKLKRLASDQEASTLASRLKGVKEEKKRLTRLLPSANQEVESTERLSISAQEEAPVSGGSSRQKAANKEKIKEVQDYRSALGRLTDIKESLIEQNRREIDLLEKLKELNFTEADVYSFFKEATEPKEGQEKEIGGQIFVYKGGKWVLKKIPKAPTTNVSTVDRKSQLEKAAKELLQVERAAQDARIELIDDAYLKEAAKLKVAHQRKLEDLRAQKVSEAEIEKLQGSIDSALVKGKAKEVIALEKIKTDWLAKNAALNKQIISEDEIAAIKQGKLVLEGYSSQLKDLEETFKRETILREIVFNEKLATLADNDKAKKALQEKFNQEELDIQAAHLKEMLRQGQLIMSQGDFGGFDLELLAPEQKDEMIKQLEELRLKLSELGLEKSKLSSGGEDSLFAGLGDGDQTDILGFTIEQWEILHDNLDTSEGKLQALTAAVGAMQIAWGTYNEYVNANERKRFKEFEKNNDQKKAKLKARLDSGLISQRQYNIGIEATEKEADKRKSELEYGAAKRKYAIDLTQAMANTSMAIINGLQSQPFFPVGIAMGALAATLGGIQIATIAKNKPVKGYESGYGPGYTFPVEREQDGKIFDASYGGAPKSGMVNKPTILVGEMPELIITNPDLKRFNPEVTASLRNEIARVRGYANGNYPGEYSRAGNTSQGAAPSANQNVSNDLLIPVLIDLTNILEGIKEEGVQAMLAEDMETFKKVKKGLTRLDSYRTKSQPR